MRPHEKIEMIFQLVTQYYKIADWRFFYRTRPSKTEWDAKAIIIMLTRNLVSESSANEYLNIEKSMERYYANYFDNYTTYKKLYDIARNIRTPQDLLALQQCKVA